jgi:adenosine/AMP kinase
MPKAKGSIVKGLELQSVRVERDDEDTQVILGMTHFIKTVPQAKFGVAFCEASAKCLVRWDGNDDRLKELARKNAYAIGAGHSFIIMLKGAFPINILRTLRTVPEVCDIICATANDLDVIVVQNERGRGIVGVIDGKRPAGIEGPEDQKWRRDFLRKIGHPRGGERGRFDHLRVKFLYR